MFGPAERKWSPDCFPALCVGSATWWVSPQALVLLEKSPTDPVCVWTQSSARATHRIATCLKGVPADTGINYLLLPHRRLLFLLRHNRGWNGGVWLREDVKMADSLWNCCTSQVSKFHIIIIICCLETTWKVIGRTFLFVTFKAASEIPSLPMEPLGNSARLTNVKLCLKTVSSREKPF